MRNVQLVILVPLLVLLSLAEARADEAALAGTADAVVAAVEAKDAKALEAQAALDIDGWIVVDELFARGRHDAAAAFAALRKGKADEKLAAYAESLKGKPVDKEIRAAFDAYTKAARARQLGDAWDALAVEVPMTPMKAIQRLEAQGMLRYSTRKPQAAAPLFAEAATKAEELGWIRAAARIHERAAVANQQMGNMGQALVHARSLLALGEHLEARELEVKGLNMVSGFLLDSEDEKTQREALAGFRRALTLLEGAEGEGRAQRMLVLTNVANVERDFGDFEAAEGHLRQALALAKELDDPISVARCEMGMATLEEARGRYEPAVASYERSLALLLDLQTRYASDPVNLQRTLRGAGIVAFNLASLHRVAGQYARSLEAYEKAGKIGEQAQDLRTVADVLMHSGFLLRRLGRPEKAREAYAKAIPIYERLGAKFNLASIHQALGTAWSVEGEHEKALEAYGTSERLYAEMGQEGRSVHARASMGGEYVFLGRTEEALAAFAAGIEVARRLQMREQLIEFLVTRARVLLDQGDLPAAAADVDEAMGMDRSQLQAGVEARAQQALAHLRRAQGRYAEAVDAVRAGILALEVTQRGLAAQVAAQARDRWTDLFELGLTSAAMASSDADVLWFLERGRGQLLAGALGSREALLAAEVPEALRSEEVGARLRVSQARSKLDRAKRRRRLLTVRRAQAEVEAALAAHEAALLRVQQRARLLADVAFVEPIPLKDLREMLAPNEMYVALAIVDKRVVALRVQGDGSKLIDLGELALIRKHIAAADPSRVEVDAGPALATLRTAVHAPLGMGAPVTTVYLSAQGDLSRICWAALDPGRAYAWMPSATTWRILAGQAEERGEGILAVGDPDYNVPAPATTEARTRAGALAPLPATRVEVERVGSQTLLGRAANEEEVLRLLGTRERWRAVHFACHGLVDTEKPQFSSLALTPSKQSDGFLTAAEVVGLRIPAELVVLSACETARGRVYASEGIMGLTRAFMQAGAPRVVCSQWKVDDEATQALMVEFYRLWNPKQGKGLAPAEALRRAQAHVRSQPKWKHPYFWAAWSLWGLPR